MPVDPYCGTVADTFEINEVPVLPSTVTAPCIATVTILAASGSPAGGNHEMFAVPAYARREESRTRSIVRREYALDRPVMRKRKLLPARIIKLRRLRPLDIPLHEEPGVIEKGTLTKTCL